MADKLENTLAGIAAAAARPGEHVLAAVSGGADSVALLRLLCLLRDRGTICLSAAHFEHGIRGEESLADQRFVQDLCARWNVPLYIGSADVPAESARLRKGLEETARDLRRAFLQNTMAQIGAGSIALAHHADDQAETVLMHLLRGSGARGAGGMRERDGVWLRPLLHCRKAELIDYLAQQGCPWREDATNAEEITARNSIRLRVMPEIETIFPGAVQAIGRFAAIARQEDAFLDRLARKWVSENALTGPYGARVSLKSLPDRALLARAMKILAGDDAVHTDVERLCLLCEKGGGKLPLRGKYAQAEAAAGEIWFLRAEIPNQKLPISPQGETKLAQWGTLRTGPGTGRIVRNDPFRQELDAQALQGACIRLWKEGDRIRPLGMGGKSRLLSDVYAGKGIPPQKRRFLPVLEKDGEILWAVGACISETAKLTENSMAVRLEWIPARETPWKNTSDDGGFGNAE